MKILIIDTVPIKASFWLANLINNLGKDKGVILDYINIDNSLPESWKNELKIYKKKNIIRHLYFGPDHKNLFLNTIFFLKLRRNINTSQYDKILSTDFINLFPRYILLTYQKKIKLINICFQNNILILEDAKKNKKIDLNFNKNKYSFLFRNKKMLFLKLQKRLFSYIKRFKKRSKYYLYFYFLPKIFVNKSLLLNAFEDQSSVAQNTDLTIVFDIKQQEKMQDYFNNVWLCNWPLNYNLIKKNNILTQNNKRRYLLTPISGPGATRKLTTKELKVYKRDLLIVIHNMQIDCVVIRPHVQSLYSNPAATQLKELLDSNNIESRIDHEKVDIEKVIHNYKVVAGFSSNVLLDSLRASDEVVVIGFEEISKTRFNDPLKVMGEDFGLNWIREGGKFNKNIFYRKKIVKDRMKLVDAVLNF